MNPARRHKKALLAITLAITMKFSPSLAFDDSKRDGFLRSPGFQVLRFPNSEILGKPNHVLAAIRDAAKEPPSERLRRPPSPEMGEGVRC